MEGKIAVEQNLTPVKDYLTGKGYNVECINFNEQSPENLRKYDAIVVSGLNSNFLGFHDTKSSASVINADGLTPEDVARELESNEQNLI